jgi:hypothetical protein
MVPPAEDLGGLVLVQARQAGTRVIVRRHAAIARSVLSELAVLKRGYRRSLEDAFAPAAVPGYFGTPAAQAKLLGYLVGLEAWHRVIFGRVQGHPAGRWLLSSAATAYDDAVDREGWRAWSELARFLADERAVFPASGPDTAAAALHPSLTSLALRSGVPWEALRPSLAAINDATKAGFEAAVSPTIEPVALRRTTYEKGGRSFQALTAIGGDAMSAARSEIAYEFGAACQIADDIYDVAEDERIGQCTLASGRLLDADDRRLLLSAPDLLPRHTEDEPALLVAAWRAFLADAQRFYDSGRRRSVWRCDLGQTVFRFGLQVLPGRP